MENKFNWTALTRDEMKWLLIDFDDTIAKNSGHPDYTPSEPLEGAVEALNKLDEMGYKITIFTARPWADHKSIEDWCSFYGVPARRIICGKPLGVSIIDDKNIEFNGDWDEAVAKVSKSLYN